MTTLVLIAKEPLPGKAKTRLNPPLSLEDAAAAGYEVVHQSMGSLDVRLANLRVGILPTLNACLFAGASR